MNRRTYRKRWLQSHKRYERKGLAIFRKRLREAANRIPFDNLANLTYRMSVDFNINTEAISKAYEDLYFYVGVTHGKKVGKAINKEIRKDFDPTSFEGGYREFIRNWLLENAGFRIESVRKELADYIIQFIADQMEEGNDIRTITRLLQKHINSRSFYRWQIMRIVRTETTAAANWGAVQAGESSGVVWEKEWISSKDARTRRRPDDLFDHFEMDGVRVPKDGKFNVNGDLIEYPGDPKGHPANIIQCRCAVAVVPKRNENGEIVFTTSRGRTITF